MTLPRRLQLVKLLRTNGLRDVERMRDEDLKDALQKLQAAMPVGKVGAPSSASASSASLVARSAAPPPILDDSDDPYALPRFREPKLSLPDNQRTFLRAIPVKPKLLFLCWDVDARLRTSLEGPVELQVFWRDYLGDPPSANELFALAPQVRMPVELSAHGWYLGIPSDRLAVTAALAVANGRRLVESNLCLAPPARPAPPGPLWLATLPPSLDRRSLANRALFAGKDGTLRRVGDSESLEARAELAGWEEEELPASATRMRPLWLTMPSSSASPSSSSSSSSLPRGKT